MKIGLNKSFELMLPNEFELVEIESEVIEAVFINKRVLQKINKSLILQILEEKVFPYVSESEIIKVDLRLKIYYDSIEGVFEV